MKHMPPSNPSNRDTKKRAAGLLWIGFICICVVIGVFGTLKPSKGKLDEAENQENAVAANECLNQAFGQTANGTIIFPEDYAGAYQRRRSGVPVRHKLRIFKKFLPCEYAILAV